MSHQTEHRPSRDTESASEARSGRGGYYLYALALESDEYEHAKWYVGITMDIDRRVAEHRRGASSKWVSQSDVDDHVVIGQWSERKARRFEDELTGHLMNEFGHRAVRGGRYTDPAVKTGPADCTDSPSPGLAKALAAVDHDELASLGESLVEEPLSETEQSRITDVKSLIDEGTGGASDDSDATPSIPRIYRRDTVKSDRPEIIQMHVQESTVDGEETLHDAVEDRLDDDVYALDLREAAYLVAMQHPDEVAAQLREWGYDLE